MAYTPPFTPPTLKRKGLHALFGGLRSPFYYTTDTVAEGQPMKLASSVSPSKLNDPVRMSKCASGASDGAKVIGLALQLTYDDNLSGQMAQLRGYHFGGDTAQRLDGMPIGLLTGQGYAILENYTGNIAAHEQLGVGPSGLLAGATTSSLASGDKVQAWAESSGIGGKPVRIRFNFDFNTSNVAS